MLTGYKSELGNSLPVDIAREYTDQPKALPQVWLQAQFPTSESPHYVGDAMGADASGNPLFGSTDVFPVDFGVRARNAVERDNLLDYVYLTLRFGVDPGTGVRWAEDFYAARGLEIVEGPLLRAYLPQPTTRAGQLYEATGTLAVRTNLAVAVVTQPITAISVTTTVALLIPLNAA